MTGLAGQVVLRVEEACVYSLLEFVKFVGGKCCVIYAVPEEPEFEGGVDRVKIETIDGFFS